MDHSNAPRPTAAPVAWRTAVVVALMLAATGCSDSTDRLVAWLEAAAEHPLSPLIVIAVFVASGFVAAPLSLIMVPTIVVYGPYLGSLWTVVGASLAGALFFWLGSRGADLAARFGRAKTDRRGLSKLVERNGVAAVAIARNLPLGPYPVVNLALGASPITLPQFLAGNLIGLTPWIAVYAITGAELRTLLSEPTPEAWLRLALTLVAVAALVAVVSAVVASRRSSETTAATDRRDA
jgi:uncharacterized membrane protein YdjX (TVP38/TMEM64 family)